MIPIDPALLTLAGVGLAGARPPERHGWDSRRDDVLAHGLAGLLALAEASGLVELDDETIERLHLQLEAEAIRAVRLEGELIRLAPLLADLPAVILKGAVLAHGAYPDPQLRPFTDLDILVPGHRIGDAIGELRARGYERTRPEPAPGFDARVGKAITLSHPGGVVVDLHRTLVAGILGESIDVDDLISRRRHVAIGGVPIPGPSWEAHLVEAALHAVVGDGLARALSIRDVAQVALHAHLDPEEAVDLARRWEVADQVAAGLRAAIVAFGLELSASLRGLADLHPALPDALPSEVRSARSRLDELRHGDLRRRITLTQALVAPSPAFLRRTYGAGPLPHLYARRWRYLFQRAVDARSTPDQLRTELSPAPPPAPEPTVHQPAAAAEPTAAPEPTATEPRAADAAERPRAKAVETVVRRRTTSAAVPPTVGPARRHAAALPRPERLTREDAARWHPQPPKQQRWSDERPARAEGAPPAGGGHGSDGPPDDGPPPDPSGDGVAQAPFGLTPEQIDLAVAPERSGVPLFAFGIGLLAATVVAAQLGITSLGIASVPLAAVLLALATSRRIRRVHPDEAWVGRWLVLGVVAKLTASYLRYLTLVVGYEGVGDATGYDGFGRQLARAWMGQGTAPVLPDLRRTNFLRWFTGVIYYLFGSNMVAGFFVFGLFALVGSYLWYRATVEAVPQLDKRVYLALVLFAPSIAFWPSSIGKESLMQLGIGAVALGTSFLVRQRLLVGLAVGAAGGWVLWVVRPHLLALVTVAAGCAYLVGRVRTSDHGLGSLVARPVGLITVALLVSFTVSQGAEFLGIEEISLSSIEAELDAQTERSAQGGSQFDNGGNSLNPLNLPRGAVTVLLRPFPWETDSPFQLFSSLESVLLAALIVVRMPSLRTALTRARATPFLLYCWVLTLLYAATFSSFANFGLLVRQRSLVLPALFVLLAVSPALERKHREGARSVEDAPWDVHALR